MENSKEMNNNDTFQDATKPSLTFTVFLGIFFCYLFRITLGAISQFSNWIIPEIHQSNSAIVYSIYYTVYFLWIVFGFWSIILALKGAKNAISCLKLCLPFHFVSFLLSSLPKLSGVNILSLIILLFPLVFFLFLCFSKDIKERYPKNERKLGALGYIGIILYLISAFLFVRRVVADVSKRHYSKKVDPDKIELFSGELTDGRVIFKPLQEWYLDSKSELNTVQDAFYFHDTISQSSISVVCATEEYEPLRYNYIYSISENQPLETRYFIEEAGYKEIDTADYIIFIDQYVYQIDSSLFYWTYASKLWKDVEKGIRLSILDKDSLKTSIDEAVEFLENTSIDIKGRSIQRKANRPKTQER